MYDACSSDEDGVLHNDTAQNTGGGGKLANLSVRVNLEHAAFLDNKVRETEIKTVVSAVKGAFPKNGRHQAKFLVLMWWKLLCGSHLLPMIMLPVHQPCDWCLLTVGGSKIMDMN
jgi:hypothetical protein